jgi:hypothetical protein
MYTNSGFTRQLLASFCYAEAHLRALQVHVCLQGKESTAVSKLLYLLDSVIILQNTSLL